MFGETCHDMAYERHMIEEKEAAARAEAQTNTMTIAQFAERTQSNLNEMTLLINDIMGNLVGLRKDEVKDVQPISSFRDVMAMNAESSTVVLSRLCELRKVLFG